MTRSDVESSRIDITETSRSTANDEFSKNDPKARFKRKDRFRRRNFKTLGTSSEVQETGTEDIPSCKSFAIAGCIGMLLIMGITAVFVARTSRYLKEHEDNWRANGTKPSIVTPRIYTLKHPVNR